MMLSFALNTMSLSGELEKDSEVCVEFMWGAEILTGVLCLMSCICTCTRKRRGTEHTDALLLEPPEMGPAGHVGPAHPVIGGLIAAKLAKEPSPHKRKQLLAQELRPQVEHIQPEHAGAI